jgi:NAD-dependent SIR2 family protein deacetylase
MAMFLKHTSGDPDLVCPHCGQEIEVEEWEEPCDGVDVERCPECSQDIRVETQIVVTYTASKVEEVQKSEPEMYEPYEIPEVQNEV